MNEVIAERTTLEREELNTKQAYEMLMQSLNAQLSHAKSNVEIISETKVRSGRPKATAEEDVADTTTIRDEDQNT